jgi:hypothetical protein
MKTYVVFECPQGSVTWTVAHREPTVGFIGRTAHFSTRECAERFCAEVMSKRRCWWGGQPDQRPMDWHIAEVELPDREQERLECKTAFEQRHG